LVIDELLYLFIVGDENFMAYVIDTYNKYDAWDRTHSLYKFEINGNWYAIKEVEMSWGLP
jgi:hypothetical protein